jgi:hypothetical protein
MDTIYKTHSFIDLKMMGKTAMAQEFDSSKWTGNGPDYDKIAYTARDAENILASTFAGSIAGVALTGIFNVAGAGMPWWMLVPPLAAVFVADALSTGKAVPQDPKP